MEKREVRTGKRVHSEQGTSERRVSFYFSGCSCYWCPLLLSQLPHKSTGVSGPCWGLRSKPRARLQVQPLLCPSSWCYIPALALLQTVLKPFRVKIFSFSSFPKSHLLYELSLLVPTERAMLQPSPSDAFCGPL